MYVFVLGMDITVTLQHDSMHIQTKHFPTLVSHTSLTFVKVSPGGSEEDM